MTTKIPALDEFIDVSQRRAEARAAHGYKALDNKVTVAVYETKAGNQILTVRFSGDIADKLNLIEGAKLSCHVHPDQQHIALMPGHGHGAALFRPKKGSGYRGRSIVYQTTLREGTLEAQPAREAQLDESDHALVITLK